jgi:hypothetical protein
MSFRQTFRAPQDYDWQQIVQRHVKSLNYGSVEITIHDSRIVQVDITERFRLGDPPRLLNAENSNRIAT